MGENHCQKCLSHTVYSWFPRVSLYGDNAGSFAVNHHQQPLIGNLAYFGSQFFHEQLAEPPEQYTSCLCTPPGWRFRENAYGSTTTATELLDWILTTDPLTDPPTTNWPTFTPGPTNQTTKVPTLLKQATKQLEPNYHLQSTQELMPVNTDFQPARTSLQPADCTN